MGATTIEFWSRLLKDPRKRSNFSYKSYMNNLYIIFGTKNIFLMFIPWVGRELPVDGVYWDDLEKTERRVLDL